MKNKKGTIILSVILAVQFIIPLSVWSYETYKNKELEEKGQEIKVLVDYASYDEQRVEFEINALSEIMYAHDMAYITFENNNTDFATIKAVENKPETDLYISPERLYIWYKEGWCFKYESDITKAQNEYDYYQLYDEGNESQNITIGYCEGPETQAYAIFKVYKNRFKVVNVYIDGMPVDTVIEMYNNNEWDNSRYEYQYGSGDYKDYEIYEYYDEELGEYVTEPYAY